MQHFEINHIMLQQKVNCLAFLGVHWIQNFAIRLDPYPNATTGEKLLFLHHNCKKLEWIFTRFCDQTSTWEIIVSDINCTELKWLSEFSFEVLYCHTSLPGMKKCCDVLHHSYVDLASIYRIPPQIRPDSDWFTSDPPNSPYIRPDPDLHPVHP